MIERIVTVPYVPGGRDWSGADCWGIVVLCHRELMGVEIDHLEHVVYQPGGPAEPTEEQVREVCHPSGQFRKVTRPRRGDCVLLSMAGHPVHAGFMLDSRNMIHSQANVGVSLADITSLYWERRVRGFFRYKGLK